MSYFPDPDQLIPDDDGLVALGGRLSPAILVEAYAKGIFPWTGERPIPWFSPDPRLVLYPEAFHASRSLRKLARSGRYAVRFDQDYDGVMEACATVPRPGQDGTWITPNMFEAYGALHQLGLAHSVEVYGGADDEGQPELVGGLYGLSLGAAFFGESMFARASNASKLALYALCECLKARGFHLIDCQAETSHLRSLGAVLIPRARYLEQLEQALQSPTARGSWAEWQAPWTAAARTATTAA